MPVFPAVPIRLPRLALLPLAAALLSACVAAAPPPPATVLGPVPVLLPDDSPPLPVREAAQNFVTVVRRMEPSIEQECRARTRNVNCDFQIVVDDRPGQDPNAFQTLDEAGRPVVAFNLALIAEARNIDELAFVMGHEAAHHIAGHIPRQQQSMAAAAVIFGGLAAAYGYDEAGIRTAQDLGAGLGGRVYAKNYELEADRLGTVIAWDAGFDPERGSRFFARLPDPGNDFLGSHPPNAQRMELVARTVADLRAGRRI